jgi:hypothetical protein
MPLGSRLMPTTAGRDLLWLPLPVIYPHGALALGADRTGSGGSTMRYTHRDRAGLFFTHTDDHAWG